MIQSSQIFFLQDAGRRAVVTEDTLPDVEALAKLLRLTVDVLRKSTTIARARSSAAVYDVHGQPERIDEITAVLRDVGMLDQHRLDLLNQPLWPADGPGESHSACQRAHPRRDGRQPYFVRRYHP